jgi:hypothetical protein
MKKVFSRIFLVLTSSVITFFAVFSLSGCAYKLSSQTDPLPGNVKSIQIPLFKNDSSEVGAETYFTNALKSEALRSKFVSIKNDESQAEGVLQGTVKSVDIIADESVIEAKNTTYMPTETVIATQYRVSVVIDLVLRKSNSTKVLWSGNFVQTQSYSAPQITLPVINTSNALYNESAKRQTLNVLSRDMMQAAFDRMVENF